MASTFNRWPEEVDQFVIDDVSTMMRSQILVETAGHLTLESEIKIQQEATSGSRSLALPFLCVTRVTGEQRGQLVIDSSYLIDGSSFSLGQENAS